MGNEKRKGFFEWLWAVYAIDPYDWDEHYSGKQLEEIQEEYAHYCDHPEDYKKYFRGEES